MDRNNKKALCIVGLALALGACKTNEPKPDAVQAVPATNTSAPVTASSPTVGDKASPEKAAPADAGSKEKTDKAGAKTTKGKTTAKADPKTDAKTAKGKTGTATADTAASDGDAKEAAPAGGAYDLSRNKPVTDSTKVVAGEGTKVKGLNDWEGEISGVPAANSKFTKLKIGMPMQQVLDMVGQPTDQGAYVTGKAFIPFYFGSDRTRWEAVYKGQGRLIFATQAGFSTSQYLIWIIHNSKEGGYR